MKKTFNVIIIVFISSMIFMSFANHERHTNLTSDDLELDFPEDVQTILKTSCFDCHLKIV